MPGSFAVQGPTQLILPGGGFPTAQTTGFRGSLTAASSNNINAPGTYDSLSFSGVVTISASNVVLSNFLITAGINDPWSLQTTGTLSNVMIKNGTIIGAGLNTTQSAAAYGFYCASNAQVTIDSLDISQVGQNAINDGQVIVTNCYMHDLNSGPGTHYECIYYGGDGGAGFSLLLQGNTFNNQQNQTAAVYIENYFGAVNNVSVDRNLMIGGDYTIYVEGNQGANNITNVSVTNNALGIGTFGYENFTQGTAPVYQVTAFNNYDYITKAPV